MAMAPHGERDVWTEGRILMSRNEGPFNLEALQISTRKTWDERIRLTASGPWVSIAIMQNSVMFTSEALDVVRKNMGDPARNGNLVASAFVVAPEIEGRALCQTIFEPIYALAGASFGVFETLDEAREWALRALAESGKNAGTS